MFVLFVHDVQETLCKVEAAGGKMLTPKMKEGEHGEHATIADTEGNAVGVYGMPGLGT